MSHLMPAYNRQPVAFTKGEGVWLWDEQGKKYLDGLAGIAVCSLGHSHPKITEVIQQQAAQLMHVSNGFQIPEQEQLAGQLAELSGLDQAFFANSGAEANEAAIKIARLFGQKKGIDNPVIITMQKSFHGRTMACITASGNINIQKGFQPLMPGFIYAPFGDSGVLEKIVKANANVVAIMAEPVQGEGGVHVPPADFLDQIRRICDDNDLLMILDEIQSGVGRTGKMFGFQHSNSVPDVMTLAKALGNGFPVGACLARGKAADLLTVGTHGTTYGGNPLACRVASMVLETMISDKVIENGAEVGQYLQEQLRAKFAGNDKVVDVRGQGLWIGIEMHKPCAALRAAAMVEGLVFNVTAGNTIRLAPPLILTKTEADLMVSILEKIIGDFN
ncbi:acetylornithine aminotransferase [Piscirickettsia salmonis]|uniref:Acetylornithine aminotransferase n=1 Tax=Piscirickettsia salmonis TaxID=1238 RepID=A0A9Q6PTF4_PISSA|nr:aspartate aminotransferase family protein [Piscirickettsia salmonis]ALA23902.1 transaminase, acetylornithine/succinylornithine family protein [Piscirickettsia salmonis]APS44318.1 acetylornithine aminotransferase [Piscirickettsia salmonis]APS47679.1 acetylornithine aminotransferase [Piscirickettsia salmonis]APS50889.1 acetylornithine aminotransferase [Piscirickettsia salmonis]APS54094.1 acetylornithine aminotransferase [Piscirickettsia salmonis]